MLQAPEHNLCDILWDEIPLFKIPNVELAIKQYREINSFSPCSPRGKAWAATTPAPLTSKKAPL